MTRHLVAYLAAAVVLFALDMLWLRVIAADWYQQGIGHLMAGDVNLVAGAAFYVLFPVGLLIFAIAPQAGAVWWRAAMMGALFGFFAYATYDLTNLATLKAWPLGLSALDVMWGTIASAAAATAGRLASAAV
jgi:uncharacterized membrane protein